MDNKFQEACIELSDISAAIAALKDGELIAYPTEAVWGVGCDPLNVEALMSLMALKSRPEDKGVILVAANLAQLKPFIQVNDEIEQVLTQDSERPTTWVVEASDRLPKLVTGRFTTVAVRISSHPVVKQLCTAFSGPIVSTSANPSGLTAATTQRQVFDYFGDKIMAYVHGELGNASSPSRIVEAQTMKVLRD